MRWKPKPVSYQKPIYRHSVPGFPGLWALVALLLTCLVGAILAKVFGSL